MDSPRHGRPISLRGVGARRALLALILWAAAAAACRAQSERLWIVRYDDDVAVDRVRAWNETLRGGDAKKIVDEAQRILDLVDGETEGRDDTFRVSMSPCAAEPETYLPIDEEVTRRLLATSPEIVAAYRTRQKDRIAVLDARYRTARDESVFRRMRRRFGIALETIDALIREGHKALEAGRIDIALRHFADALERTATDGPDSPFSKAAANGLAAALRLDGDFERARAIETLIGAGHDHPLLDRAGADDERRPERSMQSAVDARARLAEGPEGKLRSEWSFAIPVPAEAPRRRPMTDIHPVSDGAAVFFHTPFAVFALDAANGAPVFRRDFALKKVPDAAEIVRPRAFRLRSQRGALGATAYYFVVDSADGRMLSAVDRRDGKLLWSRTGLFDGPSGADRPPSAKPEAALRPETDIDDAPLLVGDDLIVTAIERSSAPRSYAAAIDPMSGAVRWVTNYGSGIPMSYQSEDGDSSFGDGERASMIAAAARGLVIVGDHLGTIAALETDTGRPRWTYRYARRGGSDDQRVGNAAISRGWRTGRVLAGRDLIVAAPADSDQLLAFHPRPPIEPDRVRTEKTFVVASIMPRRSFTSVAGILDGAVFLGGSEPRSRTPVIDCIAPAAENRLRRWPATAPLDTPEMSPGALAKNALYVATSRYVFRVDPATGALADPVFAREDKDGKGLGNLTAVTGGLLNATPTMVERLSSEPMK